MKEEKVVKAVQSGGGESGEVQNVEATGWKVIFLAGRLVGGYRGPRAQIPASSRQSSCVVPDLISAKPSS